jgi:hypothetical protein
MLCSTRRSSSSVSSTAGLQVDATKFPYDFFDAGTRSA